MSVEDRVLEAELRRERSEKEMEAVLAGGDLCPLCGWKGKYGGEKCPLCEGSGILSKEDLDAIKVVPDRIEEAEHLLETGDFERAGHIILEIAPIASRMTRSYKLLEGTSGEHREGPGRPYGARPGE